MSKINKKPIQVRVLELITGNRRWKPEISWSNKLWVSNLFRAFEVVFWRRLGKSNLDGDIIRAEASARTIVDEKGRLVIDRYFFTFEAFCEHMESLVRSYLKLSEWKRLFEQKKYLEMINQPVVLNFSLLGFALVLKSNIHSFLPLMVGAIALDTSSNGATGSTTTRTISYTCGTPNPMLVAQWIGSSDTDNFSTMTYGGTTMTQIGTQIFQARYFRQHFVLGVSGTNNFVSTNTGAGDTYQGVCLASYTGVKQSAQPDASGQSTDNNTSVAVSITVVAANSWAISQNGGQGFSINSVTNGTIRASNSTADGLYDSNGVVATGSFTMTANWSGSTNHMMHMFSFAPAPVVSNNAFLAFM